MVDLVYISHQCLSADLHSVVVDVHKSPCVIRLQKA